MSFRITPMFLGHVSLGDFNKGCFHRGRCQAARRFGVRFQAAYLLESLGLWSPINKGFHTPQVTFWILSFLEFFSSSILLYFLYYNSDRCLLFPTASPSFSILLQASLVFCQRTFFQPLVSPFFICIGFFFFFFFCSFGCLLELLLGFVTFRV